MAWAFFKSLCCKVMCRKYCTNTRPASFILLDSPPWVESHCICRVSLTVERPSSVMAVDFFFINFCASYRYVDGWLIWRRWTECGSVKDQSLWTWVSRCAHELRVALHVGICPRPDSRRKRNNFSIPMNFKLDCSGLQSCFSFRVNVSSGDCTVVLPQYRPMNIPIKKRF